MKVHGIRLRRLCALFAAAAAGAASAAPVTTGLALLWRDHEGPNTVGTGTGDNLTVVIQNVSPNLTTTGVARNPSVAQPVVERSRAAQRVADEAGGRAAQLRHQSGVGPRERGHLDQRHFLDHRCGLRVACGQLPPRHLLRVPALRPQPNGSAPGGGSVTTRRRPASGRPDLQRRPSVQRRRL